MESLKGYIYSLPSKKGGGGAAAFTLGLKVSEVA